MSVLRLLAEWWTWKSAHRKMRRRWRDAKVLLALVLVCVCCQLLGLTFGVVGYVLQQLGVIPDDAASPEDVDLVHLHAIASGDKWRLKSVQTLYKSAVMV